MSFELQLVPRVRAAQYLRMSTEHQRYSLDNQTAAIAEYAEARGYVITQTYKDAGKSGVSLRGRQGLRSLISDVMAGGVDFSTILVLDVSRWGRFQDTDEPAHYEFLCRSAGVNVQYVGELFENDGSMVSAILKNMKRVMAGEYSRELSVKISRAQMRQARLGFKQGGNIPYGIRRLLVDEDREPRFYLAPGQRKGLNTDRILFAPGTAEEIRVIRRIFKMFVDRRTSMLSIARILNEEGIPSTGGEIWSASRVRTVLSSELMIGYYVFNRTSRRLHRPLSQNPEERWIRVRVMDPIISTSLFQRAQAELAYKRGYCYAKPEMLKNLKRLYREKKSLSVAVIDACPYTPCAASYAAHFGSLHHAYELVGYEGNRTPRNKRPYFSDEALLAGIRQIHEKHGYVTIALVNSDRSLPAAKIFTDRFGSMSAAYTAAGFPTTKSESISAARKRVSERFKASKQLDVVKPRTERQAGS